MPGSTRRDVRHWLGSVRSELATAGRTRSLERLELAARKRIRSSPRYRQAVIDAFHRLSYGGETWRHADFLGVGVLKNPLDLWIYQELVHRIRPDLIVETGTMFGGSAFYLATLCDLVDNGRVVTIDITERPNRPTHPRLRYMTGSSTSEEILTEVKAMAADAAAVMVILDSDHTCGHVLEELRRYSPFVTPGSYVVVEDTNVNGHPVWPTFGPGPMEAVDAFLAETDEFEIDPDCERFLYTMNPRGYLRRRPAGPPPAP